MATTQATKDLELALKAATHAATTVEDVVEELKRGFIRDFLGTAPQLGTLRVAVTSSAGDLRNVDNEIKKAQAVIASYSKNWGKKNLKAALQPKVVKNRADLAAVLKNAQDVRTRLDTAITKLDRVQDVIESVFAAQKKARP
jgi:uncharacterized protein (DUF3084 family)